VANDAILNLRPEPSIRWQTLQRSKCLARVRFAYLRTSCYKNTSRSHPSVGICAAERHACAPAYDDGAKRLDVRPPTEIFPDHPDGALGLRNQAAACRRLAAQARTSAGTTSMTELAAHFEEQARRLDLAEPTSDTEQPVGRQKAAK
jgi:hypothetical protein